MMLIVAGPLSLGHRITKLPDAEPGYVPRPAKKSRKSLDVPLRTIRIVGGIILMRIGFELFSPSSAEASMMSAATRIAGFFVSTMGMGLVFHGVVEAVHTFAPTGTH